MWHLIYALHQLGTFNISNSDTFSHCTQHAFHAAKCCKCISEVGKGLEKYCSAFTVVWFPISLMPLKFAFTDNCSFTVVSHESPHIIKLYKSCPQILKTLNIYLGSKRGRQINIVSKIIQTMDTLRSPLDVQLLVIGEKVTEEEHLDMNVLFFCSSQSICCWLCQRQSSGLPGSLVSPSMSVLMLKSFIYSRYSLLMHFE